MGSKRTGSKPSAPTDLLAAVSREVFSASDIGTWDWDVVNDDVRANEVTAALFGVKWTDDATPLPLRCYAKAIHPDDGERFQKVLDLSVREGRFFIAEYRTIPRPGELRWVLARGVFTTDRSGKVARGAGIVIDITHLRQSEYAEDPAFFFKSDPRGEPSINTVAGKALELWEAAQALEPRDLSYVKPLLESLLFEIGQQLATSFDNEIDPMDPLQTSSLH